MSVLDDYLVDPKLSLLDKTRIRAQVLVPVLRALHAKLGKAEADALVREALRSWSKQLFAAIADGVDGNPRRKWAAINTDWTEITEQHVTVQMHRQSSQISFALLASLNSVRCSFARPTSILRRPAAAKSLSPVIRLSCKARRAARSATSSRRDNEY
jgi:hypothetical protein